MINGVLERQPRLISMISKLCMENYSILASAANTRLEATFNHLSEASLFKTKKKKRAVWIYIYCIFQYFFPILINNQILWYLTPPTKP